MVSLLLFNELNHSLAKTFYYKNVKMATLTRTCIGILTTLSRENTWLYVKLINHAKNHDELKTSTRIYNVLRHLEIPHYENMSVQYEAISKSGKNDIFRLKNVTFFLFFAQNIDCGYKLEPPR